MMWIIKRKRTSRESLLTPRKGRRGNQSGSKKDDKANKRMKTEKRKAGKHTVGLEPTISCSVGKRLIQLGYACSE